jgi:hypothetical protein
MVLKGSFVTGQRGSRVGSEVVGSVTGGIGFDGVAGFGLTDWPLVTSDKIVNITRPSNMDRHIFCAILSY